MKVRSIKPYKRLTTGLYISKWPHLKILTTENFICIGLIEIEVRRELLLFQVSQIELNLYSYLLIWDNGKANGIISWLGYLKWDSNWSKHGCYLCINKWRYIPLPIAHWLPNIMLFTAVSKLATLIEWERLYLGFVYSDEGKIHLKSSQLIQYLVLSLCVRITFGTQNTENHWRTSRQRNKSAGALIQWGKLSGGNICWKAFRATP